MKSKDYIMHLITEMANFVVDRNPNRVVISLHQEEDGLHLCVLDSTDRSDNELEEISVALNNDKRPELAEYYGTMAGSDLVGPPRLNFIGWQVKKADVSRTDIGTKIDLWLGSDNFDSSKFTI
ncbi:MAG: hypothetical protein CVV64_19610 [Candidatus Wallbacteria bacterium HGW-Wallbacteria-1]|jgi:hypothetical protein|uniref:Uncharacterized protein n=1 Tax=Candidatus Wallbacteria bacterium HGW-Wallbacteria-1 TaxID=2013854 RepID=A0A2N1PIS0_9BACT|nr:MAG: hypothetical protein CVV64_19610 [Candidatus Wallbacteria bacterium HGW-Wallbacteria-1]